MERPPIVYEDGKTVARRPRINVQMNEEEMLELMRHIQPEQATPLYNMSADTDVYLHKRQALQRNLWEAEHMNLTRRGSTLQSYIDEIKKDISKVAHSVPPTIPLAFCTREDCAKSPSDTFTILPFLNAILHLLSSLNVMRLELVPESGNSVWDTIIAETDGSARLSNSIAKMINFMRYTKMNRTTIQKAICDLSQSISNITEAIADDNTVSVLGLLYLFIEDAKAIGDSLHERNNGIFCTLMCFDLVDYRCSPTFNGVKQKLKDCICEVDMSEFFGSWQAQRKFLLNGTHKTDLEYALMCKYPDTKILSAADNSEVVYTIPVTIDLALENMDVAEFSQHLGRNLLWGFHMKWSTEWNGKHSLFSVPLTLHHDTKVGTIQVTPSGPMVIQANLTNHYKDWIFVLRGILIQCISETQTTTYATYVRQQDQWWRMEDGRIANITKEINLQTGRLARTDVSRGRIVAAYYENFMSGVTEGYYTPQSKWVAQTFKPAV